MKTLIFDLDGTLIDSKQDLANAVNEGLKAIGHKEKTVPIITEHIGNGLRYLIKESVGEVPPEDLEKATAAFKDYYQDHCVDFTKPYPHVVDVLKELKGEFLIGVVTNKHEGFSRQILDHFNLTQFISVIVGCDTTSKAKPHPEPVLKAVEDLKGDIESAIIFGDGPQDIQAGKSAGLKTCAVTYGFGFKDHVLDMKPDYIIEQFIEVKEIVNAFDK